MSTERLPLPERGAILEIDLGNGRTFLNFAKIALLWSDSSTRVIHRSHGAQQ